MVYLQFREPTAQMDQARLEKLLQALVMNAERWAARLADPAPASSPAPASDTPAAGGMLANWA
jgi:hypothetical protein